MNFLALKEESVRSRSRYIFLAHAARKYLAGLAIIGALLGVSFNLFGDIALEAVPKMHPLTAIFIFILAIILVRSRAIIGVSRGETMALFGVVAIMSVLLTMRQVLGSDIGSQLSRFGHVGSGTAISLGACSLAIVLRHTAPKVGLATGCVATVLVVASVLGHSFGQRLFEGQMAVLTLLSLLPLLLGMLSRYARHRLLRAVLLVGPVGSRTRFTLLVWCLVPWSGGLLLYQGVGLSPRAVPYEALTIGVTVFCICAVAIWSGVFHEKVDSSRRRMARKLLDVARLDNVTKILNRHGISDELACRWESFRNHGHPQCVMIVDLDHFKLITDRFGHDEGDRVLSAIRNLLTPCLRRKDALGRWGGEEFLVLVDDIDLKTAEAISERLREAVTNVAVVLHPEAQVATMLPYQTTASIGVAYFEAQDESPEDAIKRADVALYSAKENGRNRVAYENVLGAGKAA